MMVCLSTSMNHSSHSLFSHTFLVPIIVGYEKTLHTVTETDGVVELCAVIFEPMTGVAPRSFQLSASTQDITAGINHLLYAMILCHSVSMQYTLSTFS